MTANAQQRYAVGDIVENFTLIDRATNQEVSLYDLEGQVVFLEWFAHWCPFCQAAAQQVLDGVVRHYGSAGNPNGVKVKHVALNLQGSAETQTQAFVDRYQLGLVLNDFDAAVANRFQSGGQPIFAIINGVKDSTSHQQWELVYSLLGYASTNQPIQTFRERINSIEGPPALAIPTITQQPMPQRLATGSNLSLSVSASSEELTYLWKRGETTIEGQAASTLSIEDLMLEDAGQYSVTISNSSGSVTSESVTVEVVLSLADYLAQSGLDGADALAGADPDKDGFLNALEYLAQTDPDDAQSKPSMELQLAPGANGLELNASFIQHPDTIGYSLHLQTSTSPLFREEETQEQLLPTDSPLKTVVDLQSQDSKFARFRVLAN